jgi:hypothetical protein
MPLLPMALKAFDSRRMLAHRIDNTYIFGFSRSGGSACAVDVPAFQPADDIGPRPRRMIIFMLFH